MPLRFDTKTGEPRFEMHAKEKATLDAAWQILTAMDRAKPAKDIRDAADTLSSIIAIYPVKEKKQTATA